MNLVDEVYGKFEITEPILIDLINSKAVQRLKGISQGGLPERYCTQPVFTRYDHSIGVMLLLRKLGASLNEQIAGLLHDISHTAFSHIIDWVVNDSKNQKYQDNQYFNILMNSDIPKILEKHTFDVQNFVNLESYCLLEKEIPDLCADRIDYSLRVLVSLGGKNLSNKIIPHLIVKNNQIVFDSVSTAYDFSHEFLFLQRHIWSEDSHSSRYTIFSDVLKRALKLGIIYENDFFGVDEDVLRKLEVSDDEIIKNKLNVLNGKINLNYVSNGLGLKGKFRFVDPLVLNEGVLKKLSEIIPEYGLLLNGQKEFFATPKFVEVKER